MKKFIACFIVCIAMVQSIHGATSPLVESLLEYDAIIGAIGGVDPNFQVIPPTEFIVDIKRHTKQLNVLGKVKYGITTRILDEESESKCKHKKQPRARYLATLNVAPNPGIGPNIVTVVSIVPFPKMPGL